MRFPDRVAVPANVSSVWHLSLKPRMVILLLTSRFPAMSYQVITHLVCTLIRALFLGNIMKHWSWFSQMTSLSFPAVISTWCWTSSSLVRLDMYCLQ